MIHHIYYTPTSRALRRLSESQLSEIAEILSNPEALRARNASQKYRSTHAGKSIPICGFEYGHGSDRGSERVIYTYWDGKIVVLDYISAHDYHKSWSMDRALMNRWFASIQAQERPFSEIEKEHPEMGKSLSFSPRWVPASFDAQDHLLIPSAQQQELLFGQDQYPLIIEGVAGSGKTVVLSLIPEVLAYGSKESLTQQQEFFYTYPHNAQRLGEKMKKSWDDSHLAGDNSGTSWAFQATCIDDLLPEPLQHASLIRFTHHMQELQSFHKKKLLQHKKALGQKSVSPSEQPWKIVVEEGITADLLCQYMISFAVFEAYLTQSASLTGMFPSRAGLSSEALAAFETIYQEISEQECFKPIREALLTRRETAFDMIVVDEVQNISLAPLAYVIFNTKNYRVVLCGDREQASDWNSIAPLHMIGLLLNRCQISYRHQLLEKHYRCPAEVWQYTQQSLKPFKERLFGKEYATHGNDKDEGSVSPIKGAIAYLTIGSKHHQALQDFFDSIPELSPDCFIVASNSAHFQQVAQPYLKGKKLLVLDSKQIAGLEVKTVVIFNPLDFHNLSRIQQQEGKSKLRRTKLSCEEKKAYEELNHFHVALTRCTQNALILESEAHEHHYAAHGTLFSSLKTSAAIMEPSYAQATPEKLLEIYDHMGGRGNPNAEKFYHDYGKYFQHLLKEEVKGDLHNLPPHNIVLTETSPISEFIAVLAQDDSSWDRLHFLSSDLIARILFERYGKRSKKKSLFERLLQQGTEKSDTPTSEQIVWRGFLHSKAYELYINEAFFELDMPALSTARGTIKSWLAQLPETEGYKLLQAQLLPSVVPPLVKGPDLAENQILKLEGKKKKAPKHKKNLSNQAVLEKELPSEVDLVDISKNYHDLFNTNIKEIAKNFLFSIIHDDITLNKKDDAANQKKAKDFLMLNYQMVAAYGREPYNLSKEQIHIKIEELITKSCSVSPHFWSNMTLEKYNTLKKLTNNQQLFVKDLLINQAQGNSNKDPFITNVINALKKYRDNMAQQVNSLLDCDNLLCRSIKGLITVINSHLEGTRELPTLLLIMKMSGPHTSIYNQEVMEILPISMSEEILAHDTVWPGPLDAREQHFIRIRNDLLIDNHHKTVKPSLAIRVLENIAPNLSLDLEKINRKQSKDITSYCISALIYNNIYEEYDYHSFCHLVELFCSFYEHQGLSEMEVGKELENLVWGQCVDYPQFWEHLSPFKYRALIRMTNHENLFHPMEGHTKSSHGPRSNSDSLKRALGVIDASLAARTATTFHEPINIQNYPELGDGVAQAAHGIFNVIRDYRHSMQPKVLPPVSIIAWEMNPDFFEKISDNTLIKLIQKDSYWQDVPPSQEAVNQLIERLKSYEPKPSGRLQQALKKFIDSQSEIIVSSPSTPMLLSNTASRKKAHKERIFL